MSDDAWFFAGKTAVVTGGASGIGRAVVLQLVRRGARVVSLDIQDQDDGPSRWLRPVRVDLGDVAALDAVLDELTETDGPGVDFVCNAAGVSPLGQSVETVVGVDFIALRRICDRIAPTMEEGAAIVNVASVAGVYEAIDEQARALLADPDPAATMATAKELISDAGRAYAIAKRAVILHTLEVAAACAARRVRVNATSPHAAATPMHYAIKHREPEMYERAHMTAHFGRWSTVDEQADAVLFLVGPRSTYITGQNLLVDGGWWAATQTSEPQLRRLSRD
jgi:NAD(P)-dependent dehydrogenase (short-subunit alcohol dehydrogenase family)